jgi:hypothetical protein
MADSRSTGTSVWGRIADYLFGRNSLIGIASLMLLVISGYATWSGMADFIIGVSTSPAAAHSREIVGGPSVSNEILVIAVVVALTFLMWLRQAADQTAAPAELKLRAAVFTEGPAGVANAIKSLWANIGAYVGGLGEYVVSGGKVGLTRTTGGEPITGRGLIALPATLGIDSGLFALTALNPPVPSP